MAGKLHTVVIKLVDRKGSCRCPNGHEIGDQWVCEGGKTPAGLCATTYHGLFPTLWMLQNGVELHSRSGGPASIRLSCEDTNVLNVFELTRIDP